MPAKTNLRRIQFWLQEFIVDPESDQAVYGKNNDEATRLILPSRTLAPVQRVAIYRDMYLLRMEEALAGDFPVLKHHLGGQGFKDLVADYVQHYPSKSYTLNRLRKNLPDFIVEKAAVRRRAFAFDLARLELAMCEAFDAPRSSVLTPHAIAEVPETAWENARIRTIEALSLLAFRYPADESLHGHRDGSLHSTAEIIPSETQR